ncbi:trk system potassium uptake protein TrkH [Anaerobranca californiensis DSM 14826]|jgi:trk system potassium uptake protein TrkH|uniref:Trk system potassium uptake protein TrkH n=1 Tax=Anaerobranca californiensis DSM 14826 TaxID=1120989 RepID=A0A1M6PSJ7_9FIRM|nr:TrkH family potassium uptake protein [Anaerobranca californiensis]SHK10862.1 trk system potassium uptake protein TrkH [Anaerobranca californiensis DSM 14826]
MNYLIVAKVLGNLLIFKSAALVLPLLVSILYREGDYFPFLVTILFTLILGFFLSSIKVNGRIRIRESLLIVVFGWLLVSFFGSLPFVMSGYFTPVDAFFETVSGLTTTGATILDDIKILPKGILFWRSFTHWLGGMGILVLTLAILPALGVGGFQIFKAESPGPISNKLVPKMKDTAKILYTAYLGITILQVVLLYLGRMSFYESLLHTFGTMGTGGFSTRNSSIGAFNHNSYLVFVITIFMVAAGVNFFLYYDLYKGRWRSVIKNSELRWYLSIIIVASLMITINTRLTVYDSLFEAFKHSTFQVSSFITTTGYTTTDYEQWSSFSKGILFLLMFIGGSAGSTAGSVKVIRIMILWKLVKREIAKILHRKAIIPIKINNQNISLEVVTSITGFVFLYTLLLSIGILVVSLEGHSLASAASTAAATLGNIGPGFEVIGPTRTYSDFSSFTKIFLSILMLLGRLELFTLFALLMPEFWKGS